MSAVQDPSPSETGTSIADRAAEAFSTVGRFLVNQYDDWAFVGAAYGVVAIALLISIGVPLTRYVKAVRRQNRPPE